MSWTFTHPEVEFCPACGQSLTSRQTADGPRPYCTGCAVTIYRNPTPLARATLIGDDGVLLIKMADGRDKGTWALPGGHIGPRESPRQAAVRELHEETGVSVSAEDVLLSGDGYLDFADADTMVSFNYAARAVHAEGTMRARDDAEAVRF